MLGTTCTLRLTPLSQAPCSKPHAPGRRVQGAAYKQAALFEARGELNGPVTPIAAFKGLGSGSKIGLVFGPGQRG